MFLKKKYIHIYNIIFQLEKEKKNGNNILNDSQQLDDIGNTQKWVKLENLELIINNIKYMINIYKYYNKN